MSIWNGIKHALGFSHESEEDEEEYTSALPTYAVTPPPTPVTPPSAPVREDVVETPAKEDNEETAPAEEQPDSLPTELFDAVIEVFNNAQPDFVKSCLSKDAQRRYLINSISDNLRKRIAGSKETEAVMAKKAEELDSLNKRLEKLSAENNKLRLSLDRQKRAMLDRINDLEAQVAKHHAEKEKFYVEKHNPADAETIAKNSDKIAELKKELERQTTMREQLDTKSRMADEMVTELRNNLAKTRRELEQVTAEREEATKLLSEQLDGFEGVKARLEAKVKELKQKLDDEKREDREGQIAKLNEENASLRHTIENNLYNQANSEMRLRKEIKELTDQLKAAQQAAPVPVEASTPPADEAETPPAPRRRGRPKKVKVDADLDNTDWFATGAKKDDPDFGYHEPPRRPTNDNEAQLSLF